MSRRSALGPVQAAVYQKLSGDATLTALAPVFDQIPEGTNFPYIELGEFVQENDRTTGDDGRTVIATIFAWSSQPGYRELDQIDDELRRLLDDDEIADVDAADWTIWENEVVLDETTRLPDGITRQLAVRCRISVQRP